MLLQCYVADADPFALRLLCDAIERDPAATIVGAASDEQEILRDLRTLRPNALFVEARMSARILKARRASNTTTPCCLVLVSAVPADARVGPAQDATDFVIKPCSRARVAAALARVRRRLRKGAQAAASESPTLASIDRAQAS